MSDTPARTPVVIDTDPGIDDAVAVLLALASPELEPMAITTVFGNADL
ncbi:MAG: nucleoside hydrolase, partial [Pseudonocardia sp.]|nr:nucleoside hydrolase [Pseudonocardia sp.]